MGTGKVALVTGASSGIGQATAKLLAEHGYRVFGTSRKPEQGQPDGFTMLALDVRSDDSVEQFVQTVLEQTKRIDLLVNNAGYNQVGALEENSVADAQAQFDTNFFGAIRMIKAVLPVMRQQGSGQIINVSSILGLTAAPYVGIYAASKFALEGLTEALRAEVAQFNIKVSLVEPGTIKTAIGGRPPAHPDSSYNTGRQSVLGYLRNAIQNSAGPNVVAEVILRLAEQPNPRLHNVIGGQAQLVATMKRLLTGQAFERFYRRAFHVPVENRTAGGLQAAPR